MTLQNDTDLVPFFVDEEKGKFLKFARDDSIEELGILALVVSNADQIGDRLQQLSAAFLISNLLLMSRASSRIIKLVALEYDVENRDQLFPIVNGLRQLVAGEYSKLDNFDQWKRDLSKGKGLSAALDARLSDIIQFLTSSEISSADTGQQMAETILAAKSSKENVHQGLTIQDTGPFSINVRSEVDEKECRRSIAQSLVFKGFSFTTSYTKDLVVMNIDAKDLVRGLESWQGCLESFFEENMLGLGV